MCVRRTVVVVATTLCRTLSESADWFSVSVNEQHTALVKHKLCGFADADH